MGARCPRGPRGRVRPEARDGAAQAAGISSSLYARYEGRRDARRDGGDAGAPRRARRAEAPRGRAGGACRLHRAPPRETARRRAVAAVDAPLASPTLVRERTTANEYQRPLERGPSSLDPPPDDERS